MRPRLTASSRPGLEDPCKAWKLQAENPLSIIAETSFAHNILSERARLFYSFSVSQLGLELRALNLQPTRAGHIVLFMGDVLEQCETWLNEYISLHNLPADVVEMKDMYGYVAVLLLSPLTGISFEKTITLLLDLNCAPPSLDRMRFISMNIKGFSPTSRGNMSSMSWVAQRDMTQQLDAFERVSE